MSPSGNGEHMTEQGIVVVKITRDETGLYTAVSDDLVGVFVAHRNRDLIVEDMPNIIRQWFRRNRGMDVTVFHGPTEHVDDSWKLTHYPVPAEIAAAALAR